MLYWLAVPFTTDDFSLDGNHHNDAAPFTSPVTKQNQKQWNFPLVLRSYSTALPVLENRSCWYFGQLLTLNHLPLFLHFLLQKLQRPVFKLILSAMLALLLLYKHGSYWQCKRTVMITAISSCRFSICILCFFFPIQSPKDL